MIQDLSIESAMYLLRGRGLYVSYETNVVEKIFGVHGKGFVWFSIGFGGLGRVGKDL